MVDQDEYYFGPVIFPRKAQQYTENRETHTFLEGRHGFNQVIAVLVLEKFGRVDRTGSRVGGGTSIVHVKTVVAF